MSLQAFNKFDEIRQKGLDLPEKDRIKLRRGVGFHLGPPYEMLCVICLSGGVYGPFRRQDRKYLKCKRCDRLLEMEQDWENEVRKDLGILKEL